MRQTLKIAIQGEKESFHEIAANKYYTQPIELVYHKSFEEVFTSLFSGDADRAFVAVENSSHGEITEVKELVKRYKPLLEGEYVLPIDQHLIGFGSTDISKIEVVVSHPVAISQSEIYLSKNLKNAKLLHYHDTSAAIEYIKEQKDVAMAAIGSKEAASLHGLNILEHSIQNKPNNTTLFYSFIK